MNRENSVQIKVQHAWRLPPGLMSFVKMAKTRLLFVGLLMQVGLAVSPPVSASIAMIDFSYSGHWGAGPEYYLDGTVTYNNAITPTAVTVGGVSLYQYPIAPPTDITLTGGYEWWPHALNPLEPVEPGAWSLYLDSPGGSLMGIDFKASWVHLSSGGWDGSWRIQAPSGGYSPHIVLDLWWSYPSTPPKTPILQLTGSSPAVPVPASIWLLGSSLLGVLGIARRKSVNNAQE